MTNKIKIALIGALLVSTLSAASAQSFNGTQENQPGYLQQKDHATDVGSNGGA